MKRLDGKDTRKVAGNTFLSKQGDGIISLRLYNTDIIKYYFDNSITLNTGGHRTTLTKDRINDFQAYVILQIIEGDWVVKSLRDVYLFKDNMRIQEDGTADALSYAIYEIQNKICEIVTSYEDVKNLLQGYSFKEIKTMWRKCKHAKTCIASLAPIEFIPLIVPTANGNEYWYKAAVSRLTQ
jgi:hypothetical protein